MWVAGEKDRMRNTEPSELAQMEFQVQFTSFEGERKTRLLLTRASPKCPASSVLILGAYHDTERAVLRQTQVPTSKKIFRLGFCDSNMGTMGETDFTLAG